MVTITTYNIINLSNIWFFLLFNVSVMWGNQRANNTAGKILHFIKVLLLKGVMRWSYIQHIDILSLELWCILQYYLVRTAGLLSNIYKKKTFNKCRIKTYNLIRCTSCNQISNLQSRSSWEFFSNHWQPIIMPSINTNKKETHVESRKLT